MILSVFLHCVLAALANSAKLNVPRVLLSYNYEQASNFTLKVFEGGCYNWRSTRGSEVVVRPVYTDGDCVTEAVVSAVTRSPARQTAIILATDSLSGLTMRCDVIIDSITRLEIVTTTRELYVEEAPEEFEVRAYDDQGNEFSSLDGLKFDWQLENVAGQQGAVPAQLVLRFMRFTDSPYETPPAIAPLEQQGQQGSRVLIEGRQTGVGRLKVTIPHPAWHKLPPSTVTLMVIANLLLEPQDVYVLPGTPVIYTILHLKHGILHPVPLQPSHYYLSVEQDDVANLQSDGITVFSLKLGQTNVVLYDRNVKTSGSIKQPTANYHVVEPGYLTIEIEPGNKPSLIIGRHAAFHVHVFDKQNNKIFLSDNIAIKTVVPKEYFQTEEVHPNGTFVYGLPHKEGKMTVTATLSEITVGYEVLSISPPLTASVDVTIYGPVSVTPKLTILPWDAVSQPQHLVQLVVSGGSGHVVWRSNCTDVANINNNGLVTTRTLGHVAVTAAMVQNTDNYDFAVVHVLEVMGLELVEGYQEVLLNEKLQLGLAAYVSIQQKSHHHTVFSECHMLPYVVSKLSQDFESLPDITPGVLEGSCATLDVLGHQPGFSKVQVSHSLQQSGEELTVSTTVGAYHPLIVTAPDTGATVLATGTGRVIQFEGGPLPWIHKPGSHYTRVALQDGSSSKSSASDVVSAHLLAGTNNNNGGYSIFVECAHPGETRLSLTVGNAASATLPRPRQATASAVIYCAVPESMSLSVLSDTVAACPLHRHNTGIASCSSNVPLSVVVSDAQGRKLDNVSSLHFTWSSSTQLATLPKDGPLMKGYHRFPYADYGLLLSGSHEGELSVTVSLKSSSITATLKLRLVEHASIVPQQLVLYNHPSSTGYFTISGGSGYFTLLTQSKASDDQVATVSHVTANNSILVMAVDDGSRNIGISDLCLANSTARASVRVASVDTLTVLAAQLIEQGSTVQALLQLRDAEGLLIPIQPSMMRFTLAASQDEGILATEFVMINAAGEAVYEVTGRRLGDTTLIGSVAVTTEPRLTSQPCPVQVFAPLKLLPRHLTLVVGTVYQVTATGGPYPDARLEFYTSNKTVCDVSSVSGVVTAAVIGTTTVRARAYVKTTLQTTPAASTDESLHRAILECQDVVIIDVVAMASIELEAPTIHLESGTSMPLHVIGRSIIAATGDDEDDDDSEEHHQLNNSVKFSASKLTPVSYATADPPLLFEWSSSDKRVAALTNVFHENGILVGSYNNGVVRLLAHEPGHSTITVTVSPSRPTEDGSTQQLLHNKIYTAKLRVKVFESLSLLAPNTAVATVLLAPGALYQLSTNRDGRSKMSYNIGSWCASNSSTNSSSGGGVVAVSKSGVLTATAHTGDATVLVTATDAAGVTQRVAILVQVRDVRYMQASVTRVLSVTGDSNLDSVPVGATLPLIITYHDNTGRTFDAVNNTSSTPLSVNANRRDHVRCESVSSSGGASVVIANVRAPGQTVLELQHAVSSTVTLKHYLRIPSRSAVLPVQACISVGQTLCYSTAIRGAKSEDGYWFSDGPQLAVDKNSGVATALSTGRTTVTYVIEADAAGAAVLAPYVDVTVQPIEQVLLMGPNAALSDGEVGDVIHVPIALIAACDDAGQDSAVATCYPPALPSRVWLSSVKCDISLDDATKYNINEVFVAEPVYTRNLGYSCAVRVLAQQVAWLGRLYQQQPSLSLTLRVTVANTGIPSLSKWSEVRLPFVASVHVNNTAEVVVSNIDPVEERLAVFGPVTALQQLLISSNSSSVEASLGSISATDGGMAERGVQVLGVRDAWGGEGGTNTPALITITSQLTRQTIPVVVSLQQIGDGSCASPKRPAETLGLVELGLALLYHYHTHIFTVLCVVLTAASLAVGYQALFGPGYRQSQQAGVFAASPAAATPTSSPAAATPASPLSPNTGAGVLGGGNLNNISLWSIDSVYGAPHSPTTQGGRPSPRRL